MKIDDKDVLSSSLQNIAKTGAGNTAAKRPASSSATGTASSDAVELNSHSRLIADGLAAGESARAGRIAELQQIYVSGQHTVDAQELSRAIVDAHLAGG